jgi:hypothetical protein
MHSKDCGAGGDGGGSAGGAGRSGAWITPRHMMLDTYGHCPWPKKSKSA